MKILAINVLYYPLIGGGAEITIKNLYEGLTKKKHNCYVLSFSEIENSEELINGVKVIRKKIPNVYLPLPKGKRKNFILRMIWHLLNVYNISAGRIVEEVILQIKPDVIVFHNTSGWSPSAWDSAKKYNIPVVQVLHDLHFLCPRNMFNGEKICSHQCIKCKILKLPSKIGSSKIDAVVGVSNFILNMLVNYGYFKNAKIKKVIYNSRNFSLLSIKPRDISDIDNIIFGFLGTISPNKGIENLLKAFCDLNRENFILIIAGEGLDEYKTYLKRRYFNKNIHWIGYAKIEEFFPKIDFLVVPSIWYENFPGVIYESYYFGIPVIGSNIGGIPEMIKEGMNGILFDPYDVDDLKNKLVEASKSVVLFKEKFNEIRNSSRKFFDYDGWINEWEKLLLEVAKINL